MGLGLGVLCRCLSNVVPGMSCCAVMLIGAIPRLFMAVAQAFGSDMDIVIELESMGMLRIPSREREKKTKGRERDREMNQYYSCNH